VWEAIIGTVIGGIILVVLLWVWREARARDRLPIEISDATDDKLPPSFVFETEPSTPPQDPWRDATGYISSALANGGVHAYRRRRRFTIRGTEEGLVRLERVAVNVRDRRPMLQGFLLTAAAGGDSSDREILRTSTTSTRLAMRGPSA
jgi:hypothetical protein